MSQILQQQVNITTVKESREVELEIKRAKTAQLLAADRKRAEAVLLQLRYQLDITVSSVKVKG